MNNAKEAYKPIDLLAPQGEPFRGNLSDFPDTPQMVEAMKWTMRNVARRVVGRETLASQTLLALLTREHQLIFSKTGTAKSLYAETVFGQFAAETFSIQFTTGAAEEAVVGAYDLAKFREGVIWHNTEKSLVTAEFAFLDEFMDANDMVLRSILGILNERKFSKGKQLEQARLHSAIATTNYIRRSGMSEAVVDRFLFQARINPETSLLDQLLIDRVYAEHNGRIIKPEKPLPIDVLRALSRIVKGESSTNINATNALFFLKNQLIKNYTDMLTDQRRKQNKDAERPYVSPRKLAKARDVLNASALLQGRLEVTVEDLPALRFMLTTISGSGEDGSQEEEIFYKALDHTLASFTQAELTNVEKIMLIYEYYEAYRDGKLVEATRADEPAILRYIKSLLGFASWEDANDEVFLQTLRAIEVRSLEVAKLKDDLAGKISKYA